MTNGDYIRQMDDDSLAEWLVKQIWTEPLSFQQHTVRYHLIRNFLKGNYIEEESTSMSENDKIELLRSGIGSFNTT